MDRVEVTIPVVGDCGLYGLAMMQVCAVADASDEEILAACNKENPSGTSRGWSEVVREVKAESVYHEPNKMPVTCAKHNDRKHFLVLC